MYTHLPAENNNADMAYKLADIAKIGVIGHSLGGSAALSIGRMRDDVNAVVALESPFMYEIEGIEDDRFVFTDKTYGKHNPLIDNNYYFLIIEINKIFLIIKTHF